MTNNELISKIMERIKNSRSAVFNGSNSFYTTNQKKFLTNLNENKTINSLSISPTAKINSFSKKNNKARGIIISINESNSTPSIIKMKYKKINKKENQVNNAQKLKEDNKNESKLIKVNSNINISPLNEIYIKKDFYKHENNKTNSNVNIHKNTCQNYIKNKICTSNTIINKNEIKKTQKRNEKEIKKIKKFNLDVYKVAQSSITQKYINNKIKKYEHIPTSNKAITISELKPFSETKFSRIKVVKKQKTIDSKNIFKTKINNNININININNNNIYNNTNQISHNNSNHINSNITNNSINSNNKIFDKKKYIEFINQSSFNTQRNDSQPLLKKILLSSSSNRDINYIKKDFIFQNMNKKKISYVNPNNNTLAFSGYLTSRNSHNISKIKNKIKNMVINSSNQYNNNNYKFKKDLLNKKERVIFVKNKKPILKSPKNNNNKFVKK